MRVIDRAASILLTVGATLLVLAMTGVITADVLLRSITGRGLPWALDVTSMCLVSFFFVILPGSLRADTHVRMDIFYNLFGPSVRAFANFLGGIGALLFFGSVVWRAWREAPQMLAFGIASPTVELPMWPVTAFVGFCGAVALAVLVSIAVEKVRKRSSQ